MKVIKCKSCGEKFYQEKVVCPFCKTVNSSSSEPPKSLSDTPISIKMVIGFVIFIIAMIRLLMLFF